MYLLRVGVQTCGSDKASVDSRSGYDSRIHGVRPAGGVPPSKSAILPICRTHEDSHPPISHCGIFKHKKPHCCSSLFKMAVREGLCAGAHPFGAVAARRCLASLGSNPRGFSPSHKLSREFQAQKKPHYCSSLIKMAVREGFEPSIRCRIHTFQACSFSHSDTSPFLIPY